MESMTEGLQQLDEVLTSVKDFLAQMKDKERLRIKLQSRIKALEDKRIELEASLAQREADFLADQRKKGEEIIAGAQKRAEERKESILSAAKTELAGLTGRNDALKKSISNLDAVYANRTTEIHASIKELEGKRDALANEVALATQARDELQKQIDSIKEKASLILK